MADYVSISKLSESPFIDVIHSSVEAQHKEIYLLSYGGKLALLIESTKSLAPYLLFMFLASALFHGGVKSTAPSLYCCIFV